MNNNYLFTTIIIILYIGIIFLIHKLKVKNISFSKQVLTAMSLGAGLGLAAQYFIPSQSSLISEYIDIIGSGFVSLLQMLVIPLIFISITGAIVKHESNNGKLAKSAFTILSILIGTTIIAAAVGIAAANIFSLSAEGLAAGDAEILRSSQINDINGNIANSSYADRILQFIPQNIFFDFTGARSTSTIAVVIFSALLGISSRSLINSKPDTFRRLKKAISVAEDVIMELVKFIVKLTPYGISALIFKVAATSSIDSIFQLGNFILASYCAIIVMFLVHILLISLFGINPVTYIKNSLSVLIFAFTSRSSAASLPMNVETQTTKLGVNKSIANLSASLGTAIGQNGCAAIYPAMLAVMSAPLSGIDPLTPIFIIELILIIVISSFGVAGIGGGATIAAIIVLSNMGLPITTAALLISVEPLIDMSRTALNVNGAMTAGVITSRIIKSTESDDNSPNQESEITEIESEETMCSIFR